MIRFFSILFILFLITGCMRPTGGPARVTETPAPPAIPVDSMQSTQNEEFDPLSLNDDDISFGAFQKSTEVAMGVVVAPKPQPRQVNGFRVQIFAVADEQVARMAEEEAHFEFTTRIYLVFDPPNYKIRLGDFLTRDEADDLRREAYRKGYRDAWVVPDQVWVGLPAEPDTTTTSPDSLGGSELKEVKP
jgi:hypothetical protein